MKHKTIDSFGDPKFRLLQELVKDFETVESETPTSLRRDFVSRGRQWGRGEVPEASAEALGVSEKLLKYGDKCARYAYRVLDREVDDLSEEGVSDVEIADVTLAATLGVSLARLEQGLALLEEVE